MTSRRQEMPLRRVCYGWNSEGFSSSCYYVLGSLLFLREPFPFLFFPLTLFFDSIMYSLDIAFFSLVFFFWSEAVVIPFFLCWPSPI
jgi:hypothetical protein